MTMTHPNIAYRSNQNVDRFLIVIIREKRFLWTHEEIKYLMIPKEIDIEAARIFFEAHPITPNWNTYVKYLIWLGAYEATKNDFAVIPVKVKR